MLRFKSQIIALSAAAAIAAGSASAQKGTLAKTPVPPVVPGCVTAFSASDWTTMLNDIRADKPEMVKMLETNAEFRAKQAQSMRELFAFGCQAVKDGFLNDLVNRAELENIRAEIAASEYEKAAAKPAPKERLGSVGDARVAAFYKQAGNEERFDTFLKTKLELLARAKPDEPARKVTAEEREQVRDSFARISLLAADSALPAAVKYAGLRQRIAVQVKLQQAQFLAGLTARRMSDSIAATDAEINTYLASHPELDVSARKTKAEGILKRAVAGEDFATLANTYSEDPGNMSEDGTPQGGLYAEVPRGKMLAEFEKAALALEPGAVSPVLTQSDYGFHIIKLVRKAGSGDSIKYDVRHVLILSGVQDPDDPNGPAVPPAELARRMIERQRENEAASRIVRDNPVDMAEMSPVAAPVRKTPARRKPGK